MLAALYLRGGPRPAEPMRSGWVSVAKALRRAGCPPSLASAALRQAGHWSEAAILESPGVLAWAESQVEQGRVLTALSPTYPWRWIRVLGSSAPPALWQRGSPPEGPYLSIVGSRQPPGDAAAFCTAVAVEACLMGYAVVSGRAEGCDRAAAAGAALAGGGLLEVLPHGIDQAGGPELGCLLSVCAPGEPFSSAAAMERNALIYAASSHTVVGHARFKQGGTWHGAVHASRCRLGTLVVRRSPDLAMRSLAALGGVWIEEPAQLSHALRSRGLQAELFGDAV